MFCIGAGAAWLWQGGPREALTPATVQEMSGFLSTAHPRLRVLGGTRFNTIQEPQPEWAEFGSYCFMLPRSALIVIQCDETADCRFEVLEVAIPSSQLVEIFLDAYCVCRL